MRSLHETLLGEPALTRPRVDPPTCPVDERPQQAVREHAADHANAQAAIQPRHAREQRFRVCRVCTPHKAQELGQRCPRGEGRERALLRFRLDRLDVSFNETLQRAELCWLCWLYWLVSTKRELPRFARSLCHSHPRGRSAPSS